MVISTRTFCASPFIMLVVMRKPSPLTASGLLSKPMVGSTGGAVFLPGFVA